MFDISRHHTQERQRDVEYSTNNVAKIDLFVRSSLFLGVIEAMIIEAARHTLYITAC
jgi:hypothetical protein